MRFRERKVIKASQSLYMGNMWLHGLAQI